MAATLVTNYHQIALSIKQIMFDTWKRLFLTACVGIVIIMSVWAGHGYFSLFSVSTECVLENHSKLESETQKQTSNITETVAATNGNGLYLDESLLIKDVNLRDGRLGNQMFRYASLLGIARTQGRILVVSTGSEIEKTFKLLHVDKNKTMKNWSVIHETNALSFDQKLMNLPRKNFQINGFLQSFRYFVGIADELRHEYTFRDEISSQAHAILDDIHAKYRGSLIVGVHVRRGDFTQDYNQRLGYGVPEKSYFTKAFSCMKAQFPGNNVTFIIVSDDLPWCSKHLKDNGVLVIPNASPEVHLAVLAGCDHMILSGGTYGWWGAWLSGGHVIYFKGYLAQSTTFGDMLNRTDYYPHYWTGLDN